MSVPQKIGPYEIVRLECRHDLSDVYSAHDPDENRKVSIRVWNNAQLEYYEDIFPHKSGPDLKSAILNQTGAARSLKHDNIAKIYNVGEDTAQGLLYVVSEWIDFRDILIYTKRGTVLPPKYVLGVIYKLALALHHAHRHNVVHLYLCPLTIFLDTKTNTVKLVGFEEAPMAERVRPRGIIGAPFPSDSYKFVRGDLMYMAPELVTDEPVDRRTDLFSLGLVFLTLLVGRPPMADRLGELLVDIPRDLECGGWKRGFLRRKRQPDAAAIIRRALERYAKDRYQTGAEMAKDIRVLAESLRKKSD